MEILKVLLVVQILLTISSCQRHCQTEKDCDGWLACENNVCTKCGKIGTACGSGLTYPCCDKSRCMPIAGGNFSQCLPDHFSGDCASDADCAYGLKCLLRIGKCGICKYTGSQCSPGMEQLDQGLECCSGYCSRDCHVCADVSICRNQFRAAKANSVLY